MKRHKGRKINKNELVLFIIHCTYGTYLCGFRLVTRLEILIAFRLKHTILTL